MPRSTPAELDQDFARALNDGDLDGLRRSARDERNWNASGPPAGRRHLALRCRGARHFDSSGGRDAPES